MVWKNLAKLNTILSLIIWLWFSLLVISVQYMFVGDFWGIFKCELIRSHPVCSTRKRVREFKLQPSNLLLIDSVYESVLQLLFIILWSLRLFVAVWKNISCNLSIIISAFDEESSFVVQHFNSQWSSMHMTSQLEAILFFRIYFFYSHDIRSCQTDKNGWWSFRKYEQLE